jgi:hypothetical protein
MHELPTKRLVDSLSRGGDCPDTLHSVTDSPPTDRDANAWPPLSPERVVAAVRDLSAGVEEPALRAQLHSLLAVLECLEAQRVQQHAREDLGTLEAELNAALAAGDEPAVLASARRLAARQRSLVGAVDWSAVSGG